MSCCCCNNRLELTDDQRRELLNKIIKIEEDMFVNVNAGLSKAECQSQLKTFHAMRSMSFGVLSNDTLQSYYEDLRFALQDRRNLVKEKYARMDDLIPVLNDNVLIGQIVDIETAWMQELHQRYPHAVGMSPDFANYERSELETYSDTTLSYYYQDVEAAKKAGINLVEERYKLLYKGMGFSSIKEVEEHAVNKAKN